MRPKIVIGNWKMYKGIAESQQYVKDLSSYLNSTDMFVGLAVPFTSITSLSEISKQVPIHIGAQNMHSSLHGAFTGEISSRMLKEAGANFVLLGHSERRYLFSEDDLFIKAKLDAALNEELKVVLCVSDSLDDYNNGKESEVICRQLQIALSNISEKDVDNIIVSYEPYWAIGKGECASSEHIKKICELIRLTLVELFAVHSDSISIIYGGSVKPDNAKDLLKLDSIDGFLVGGSSLNPEDFHEIIKCLQSSV